MVLEARGEEAVRRPDAGEKGPRLGVVREGVVHEPAARRAEEAEARQGVLLEGGVGAQEAVEGEDARRVGVGRVAEGEGRVRIPVRGWFGVGIWVFLALSVDDALMRACYTLHAALRNRDEVGLGWWWKNGGRRWRGMHA